jgi:hypothetical protein
MRRSGKAVTMSSSAPTTLSIFIPNYNNFPNASLLAFGRVTVNSQKEVKRWGCWAGDAESRISARPTPHN